MVYARISARYGFGMVIGIGMMFLRTFTIEESSLRFHEDVFPERGPILRGNRVCHRNVVVESDVTPYANGMLIRKPYEITVCVGSITDETSRFTTRFEFRKIVGVSLATCDVRSKHSKI